MEDKINDSLEILRNELAEQEDIFNFQIKDFEKITEDINLVISYVASGKATLHEIAIFFREIKDFRDNLKPIIKSAKRKMNK